MFISKASKYLSSVIATCSIGSCICYGEYKIECYSKCKNPSNEIIKRVDEILEDNNLIIHGINDAATRLEDKSMKIFVSTDDND